MLLTVNAGLSKDFIDMLLPVFVQFS